MRKIKLFLTALAVMITSVAFAQSLTVTGNVTDASTGETVPFASVHEKGTMNGISTDVDGFYSITVSKNAVLVFSSVGYESVEVPVNGKAQINCELPLDSEMLDNAVVIGYGSAKKVGTVVGSVTTVKSDAIKNRYMTTNVKSLAYLTDEEVKAVIKSATGLTVVVYDKMYRDEDKVAHKFVPDGYVSLIPEGELGSTWYGTTPEEADLIGSATAEVAIVNTGVAITRVIEEHPVNINTFASEIVMPSYERMDEVALIKVVA